MIFGDLFILKNDVPMSEIVSKGKVSVCIMHNSTRLYEADAANKQEIGNNNDEIIAGTVTNVSDLQSLPELQRTG